MADWSTVAIAIVSAGAALGGVFLKGKQDWKAERRRAAREDAAELRARLEQLLLEIDLFADQTNANNLAHLLSAMQNKPLAERQERPSISKIRALVSLHFPEGRSALARYDEQQVKNINSFKEDFAQPGKLKEAGLIAHQRQAKAVEELTLELRQVLQNIAERIGLSKDDLTVD